MNKKARKRITRQRKHPIRSLSPLHRGNDESFRLNKVLSSMIKNYWPESEIQVFPEVKGIDNPDIVISLNDLKIPVEVKTRKNGYCTLLYNGNTCTVRYFPSEHYKGGNLYSGFETKDFANQVTATLMNYGIALFLINGRVRPKTPICRLEKRGLVILSELSTLEQSLDTGYGFLDSR